MTYMPKAGVLDRIEQSFSILLKNPILLIGPLALFQIIMTLILPEIGFLLLLSGNLAESQSINSTIYTGFSLFVVYMLAYLILVIPFTLAIIRGSTLLIQGDTPHIKETLIYGFSFLGKSFSVYWYMFAYSYLLPACIFIVGGLCLIGGLYYNIYNLNVIGYIISGFAVLLFLTYGGYRAFRSSFAIQAAVFHNDYTKDIFTKSVFITKGNIWRILGNYILVGLIGSLLLSIVSGLIGSINFLTADTSDLLNIENSSLTENIESFFSSLGNTSFIELILEAVSIILSSALTVFTLIFSLVFYLRLSHESHSKKTSDIPLNTNSEITEL